MAGLPRTTLIVLLALALGLGLLPADTTQAQTQDWAAVTSSSLNVRAGPSTSTGIIRTLDSNEDVTVVRTVAGEEVMPGNLIWYELSNGGYVYSPYVTTVGPAVQVTDLTGRWIEVDRSAQVVRAVEDGNVVHTAEATVGVPAYPTPTGRFEVIRRVENETMDSRTVGIPLSSEDGYYLEDVLYTQYITADGVALHTNYWSPDAAFGNYPGSHGCIGLREEDARFLWEFAGLGTPVIILR